MKEDFIIAREELSRIGILQVARDFYMEPQRKSTKYFVKSPHSEDQHWSCVLWTGNNRFTDFSNGGYSGDVIGFIAYVKNCSQWTALKELQAFYGLASKEERNREEVRRRIERQKQEEKRRAEKRQAFQEALLACIDHLKRWSSIYMAILEKRLYEPFSEEWQHCIEELQRAEYQLDVLCGVSYRRRDSKEYGKWLLDSLAILKEKCMFEITEKEVEEIGRGGGVG